MSFPNAPKPMACLTPITFAGHSFLAHPSGALIWPAHNCVIVADMHLEKASGLAQTGQFLPPYDSQRTVERLESLVAGELQALLENARIETLICLGDSFQDEQAAKRLPQTLSARLDDLARDHRLVWIAGNHDPLSTGLAEHDLPGEVHAELHWSGIALRHEPRPTPELDGTPEIIGHFHPKARVNGRGRGFSRPCFLVGHRRLILPAFGTYVGGMKSNDPTIKGLFESPVATYVLGQSRVQRLA